MLEKFRFIAFLLVPLLIVGCGPTRQPLPIGEIPVQQNVPQSEEEYGQEVFRQLSDQFTLDRDDARINRARRIVDQLTTVRGNNQNIWHVFVFKDDSFHNAGATRGNYIFVWSALLDAIPDDAELSSILAHEIGHVLAGHTQPDPVEEAQQMLASITGDTASRMMTIYGNNTISALAGLGGLIASELMEALIVNPNKQANELEADQLGLFVMAEAGFDPRKAISFWTRAQHDPNFQSTPIEFLSTHPSSETRLERLLQILPQAMTRYEQRGSGDGNGNGKASVLSEHAMEQSVAARDHATLPPSESSKRWIAAEQGISVFGQADKSAAQIGTLDKGQHVTVKHRLRRWLFITAPYEGYVESHRFYPEN